MEYLELQGVLEDGAKIHNVEHRNNRVYFKIGGHLFSTYGNYVHHQKHPIFDHPVTDFFARRANTAEGIAEEEKSMEKTEKKFDEFEEHKIALYKFIFLKGLEFLVKENNPEKFIQYIDHHFDITENGDNCQKLIKLIKKVDK